MKRILAFALALIICLSLCGCGSAPDVKKDAAGLSFSASNSIKEIEALNGKNVTIMGYMATLSPVSGKFMYLMNMPYQSCPFCKPNTTQLANTMAVYAPKGKTFEFTDQAIRVYGKLEVGAFTDEFGYEYNYRITDAVYEVVDMASLSPKHALWQSLASSGVIADIYSMFDYLYFVCQWSDYTFNMLDENGEEITVWFWSGDVMNYLEDDKFGYKKETSEDYFPGLIRAVRAVNATEFEDLVKILEDSAAVSRFALDDLYAGNNHMDAENERCIQNNYDDLYLMWQDVYYRFGDWMARWEF